MVEQGKARTDMRKIELRYRLITRAVVLLSTGLLSSCSQLSGLGIDKTVTILGLVQNEQQEKLEAALRPFEEKTGIDVVYEGRFDFASVLPEQVAAGNPPDIAMFPQPALIDQFAKSGDLVPLTFLDERSLQKAYSQTWLDLGEVNGVPYGIWYRASVKSLVWYRPTAFEAQGYDIPNNWDELIALSDKIVSDGGTPWCIGLENGEATGWPGTDWIEDILLRTASPEVYAQWVARQLPFASPQVVRAFDIFGEILRQPGYVEDGAISTITTEFSVSPLGIFGNPPDCYMHRQANFIESFFPESEQPGIDYDAFLLPEIDPEFGTPVLVGGDAFSMFNDTPEARQFIEYITTPEPHEIWAELGGFISPHKEISLGAYPNEVDRAIAQILQDAEVVRFDASDRLPPSVRTGFWRGMVDFAAGKSAEEVVESIEERWPEP